MSSKYDDPEDFLPSEYNELGSDGADVFVDMQHVGGEHDDGAVNETEFEKLVREQDDAIARDYEIDADLAWKVRVGRLGREIRSRPLPGFTLREHVWEHFTVEYFSLGERPQATYLRNLFSEASHLAAQSGAQSPNDDIAWVSGQFLQCRNEALGRFCYNTNCPTLIKPLPQEEKRPGRPRKYCCDRCQEAGVKRHRANAQNPQREERLRDLTPSWYIRPSYAGKAHHGLRRPQPLRDRDFDDPTWKALQKKLKPPAQSASQENRDALSGKRSRLRGVPQADEFRVPKDLANEVAPQLTSDQAGNRLEARRRRSRDGSRAKWERERKRARVRRLELELGAPLDEAVLRALVDGYVFSNSETAEIEDLLGRSIESLDDGDDLSDREQSEDDA